MDVEQKKLEKQAWEILSVAIEAVRADRLIAEQVQLRRQMFTAAGLEIDLKAVESLWVIGAGKASAHMAEALENILGKRISGGVVITKDGHLRPCKRVEICQASHPIIDERALAATAKILRLLKQRRQKEVVICLISGGGSALLELPARGVQLSELQWLSGQLMQRGADIAELNTVRKHFSRVKGGQLAREILPATGLCLMISDVPGDDPALIASGPTSPDPSSFADTAAVLEKYGLIDVLPAGLHRRLKAGLEGAVPDTPDRFPPRYAGRMHNIILGNNRRALEAAVEKAVELGFEARIICDSLAGEARRVGRELAELLQKELRRPDSNPRPRCLIFGGETTVTVAGPGKGGRNQELALAALQSLIDVERPFILASCGTDGADGPTDAAGAWITPAVLESVRHSGINPAPYLKNNDSYHFWKEAGGLLHTGPTGTNVMDIGMILIP